MTDDIKAVLVTFYTGEYANALLQPIHQRGLWVSTDDMMTFEAGWLAAGGSTNDVREAENMTKAWGKHLDAYTKPPNTFVNCSLDVLDQTANAVFVRARADVLYDVAHDFAFTLIADAPDVSGDDTYFDYFPDAMQALYQLCRAVDTPETKRLYLETRDTCYHARYDDDIEFDTVDSLAPHWGPTE